MTSLFTLISAEMRDGESLADIRVAAMRESLIAVGRFDAERARRRFLDSFDPAYTRKIMVAGRCVGFVVVRPEVDSLLLDHLYLLPQDQGKGIGQAVLKQVFAEADQALRVGALKGSRSNDFYRRHGFVLIEETEWDRYYWRKPEVR